MPVYLIQAGDSGPVKLGHARNPAKRMAGFQCGNHEVLRLVRTWPGGQPEEAALHRAFSDYRLQGEWFRFCSAMLDADPAELRNAKPAQSRKEMKVRSFAGCLIQDFGGAAKLADALGSKRTAVSNWPRDGVPAKFWHVLVAMAAEAEMDGVTFDTLAASRQALVPSRDATAERQVA